MPNTRVGFVITGNGYDVEMVVSFPSIKERSEWENMFDSAPGQIPDDCMKFNMPEFIDSYNTSNPNSTMSCYEDSYSRYVQEQENKGRVVARTLKEYLMNAWEVAD